MNFSHSAFETELKKQFTNMSHLVTEDIIRHWFIETQSLVYGETRIEKPYKQLRIKSAYNGVINNRARADLYYEEDGNEDIVIEFKYHKKVDTSTTCKTTNMGEVLRDLNRLSCLDNKEKCFIYVFDASMQNYYNTIMKKHAPTCPLQMFDISPTAIGKSFKVNGTLDTVTHDYNAFRRTAFSSFVSTYNNFSNFDYSIKILQAQPIGTTGFYIIIAQVK